MSKIRRIFKMKNKITKKAIAILMLLTRHHCKVCGSCIELQLCIPHKIRGKGTLFAPNNKKTNIYSYFCTTFYRI